LYIDAVKDAAIELPVMVVTSDTHSEAINPDLPKASVSWVSLHSEPTALIHSIQKGIDGQGQESNREAMRPVFIGKTPAVQRLRKQVGRLNRLDDAIFIQGGPGTGKEHLARYFASGIAVDDFIKVDCATLTEAAFKMELLPLLSGAGNSGRRLSRLILLDKVDALGHQLQTLLLGQFVAGETLAAASPFSGGRWRFIATGGTDLESRVNGGRFRGDLFHRLNVIKLKLPSLKERKADIPLLAQFFIYRFSRRWGRSCISLPANLRELMALYDWPGNIDELKRFVSDMVAAQSAAAAGNHPWFGQQLKRLKAGLKPTVVQAPEAHRESIDRKLRSGKPYPLKMVTDRYVAKIEKGILEQVLVHTHWNRRKAAELLDVSYKSVLNKIRDYGLT
jgi:DNA-binding NtrC family response regulator